MVVYIDPLGTKRLLLLPAAAGRAGEEQGFRIRDLGKWEFPKIGDPNLVQDPSYKFPKIRYPYFRKLPNWIRF